MSAAYLAVVGTPRRAGGAPAPASSAPPLRVRIIDGALEVVARRGVSGTTLDDVALQAGCSRATVYRSFPGGKDALLSAVVETEVSRLFARMAVRMGEARSLEDVLVAGMTTAADHVTRHRALGHLVEHEPETVLPQLAFARMDDVLAVACTFAAPFLGRWLDAAESRRVAEWAARIVVSYLLCPAEGVDLTDAKAVGRLVRTFVLPGIRALSAQGETAATRRGRPGRRAPVDPTDHCDRTSEGEAS